MSEEVLAFIIRLIGEAFSADIQVDSEYCVKSDGSDEEAVPNLEARTQRLHELSGIPVDELSRRIEQSRYDAT